MNTPLRTIALGETPPPTHTVCMPVCAMRILATDEIATHHRLTVILDGEPAHVAVPPPGDSCWGAVPPTHRDVLLIAADGSFSHAPADVFEAAAIPLPRADAGCGASPVPRVPRFPE